MKSFQSISQMLSPASTWTTSRPAVTSELASLQPTPVSTVFEHEDSGGLTRSQSLDRVFLLAANRSFQEAASAWFPQSELSAGTLARLSDLPHSDRKDVIKDLSLKQPLVAAAVLASMTSFLSTRPDLAGLFSRTIQRRLVKGFRSISPDFKSSALRWLFAVAGEVLRELSPDAVREALRAFCDCRPRTAPAETETEVESAPHGPAVADVSLGARSSEPLSGSEAKSRCSDKPLPSTGVERGGADFPAIESGPFANAIANIAQETGIRAAMKRLKSGDYSDDPEKRATQLEQDRQAISRWTSMLQLLSQVAKAFDTTGKSIIRNFS